MEFRDFGVFETRVRASRIAQNPRTLDRVEVPAKRTVKFKMGRLMRENLYAPTSEAEKSV
ncbi:MAG: HU family DNA-binding protein [Planctomycetota bacterium]